MGESTGEILRFVPRFVNWLKHGFDVYTDQVITSTFGLVWLIKELQLCHITIDCILFDTDTPWSSFESEYWKVEGLETSDEIKNKILY